MGVKWTEEQQQVIDLRDHNILVSAAAGSGKTAVLVERIIARLTRDANPVDVDHMLIVTYTEAAAAEMKERIGAAIEKELEEDPSSEHLKRQSALIHTAKITTIHSFCLSVIREYFHTIDLDPGFRIAEEGELKLLKQDVMKELLEAKYEEGNEDFLRFVETFATGREDLQVEEIISRLYEFAGSYPDPEEWLDDCARMYEESGEKAIYIEKVMEYIRRTVADMQMLMEKRIRFAWNRTDRICKEARAQSNTRKRGAVKRKNKAARKKKREQRQHQGLRERAHERKEELQQKANEETQVRGRPVRRGDIFKIVGLAAFVGIVSLVSWLVRPYIHMMFEPGGIDQVIDSVRNAGPMGFLILLALQFLQIVVAFIPGEATQMAAGMLYGPWIGALVILLGSILSSAFVFMVVHRLGAPFVKDMVSEKWMDKFDRFERSGKLELIVFVLFLIPGMPKDIFTYLVPLTDMRMRTFLLLSNIGRIPGILVSTYAASGLVDETCGRASSYSRCWPWSRWCA